MARSGLVDSVRIRKQAIHERYTKGLRKRKCIICGIPAKSRCSFCVCAPCCLETQNACSVHVKQPNKSLLKGSRSSRLQLSIPPAPPAAACSSQAMIPTLHATDMLTSSRFLGSTYYLPPPYNIPTSSLGMTLDGVVTLNPAAAIGPKTFVEPAGSGHQWAHGSHAASSSLKTLQDLQRLNNLRIAAQKEAFLTSAWRLEKLKEHTTGERLAEDEAFHRYMLNASLLEEVFTLHKTCSGFQELDKSLRLQFEKDLDVEALGLDQTFTQDQALNSLRVWLSIHLDPERRRSRKRRLQLTIDRAFRKFNSSDQDERFTPADHWVPSKEKPYLVPFGRPNSVGSERHRDSKRARGLCLEEAAQILITTEIFGDLLESLDDIHCVKDVQECMDLYKKNLGGNLTGLLPSLMLSQVDQLQNHCDAANSSSNCNWGERPSSHSGQSLLKAKGPLCDSNFRAMQLGRGISPWSQSESFSGGVGLCSPLSQFQDAGLVLETDVMASSFLQMASESTHQCQDNGLYGHRIFLMGQGWWRVYAPNKTIQKMCYERASASNTVIMEL